MPAQDLAGPEEGQGQFEGDLEPESLEADEAVDPADRVGRIHQVLAVASLVLSGVSLLGSLVVVTLLRRGFAADESDGALLGQVNPWYAAAIGTFLAALVLLVAWGVLALKRSPAGQRGPGVVPAAVGLAFAALAWAYSLYGRLD